MDTTEASVLFERSGDVVTPTRHALGPWSDGRLHGGAVAGLLAEIIDEQRTDPQQISTFRVELFGPVPKEQMTATATVVRSGKRLSMIDAQLQSGGRIRARASAIAVAPGSKGGPDAVQPIAVAGPDEGTAPSRRVQTSSPYFEGLDFRAVSGQIGIPGPAEIWTRVTHLWFEGRKPSPLARLLAVADTAYGYGLPVSSADWLVTNVDLTVHLHRPLEGDWIFVDARTELGPNGLGVGHSQLADFNGRIGHISQLVVASPNLPEYNA